MPAQDLREPSPDILSPHGLPVCWSSGTTRYSTQPQTALATLPVRWGHVTVLVKRVEAANRLLPSSSHAGFLSNRMEWATPCLLSRKLTMVCHLQILVISYPGKNG